jgi:histidyl-tRNA synthetase
MLLAEAPAAPRPIAIIPLGDAAEAAALGLLRALRQSGLRAELAYRGNLKRRMERANKAAATAAIIIGDEELAACVATVRNLNDGSQTKVAFALLFFRKEESC